MLLATSTVTSEHWKLDAFWLLWIIIRTYKQCQLISNVSIANYSYRHWDTETQKMYKKLSVPL